MPPPRSMTFTGCWTCKKRKVKCDERPLSCGNCEKMRISCGGYGIKLQWIPISDKSVKSEESSTKSSGRGRILIPRDAGPTYDLNEIDDLLETLEKQARSRSWSRVGPFTVFPLFTEETETRERKIIEPEPTNGENQIVGLPPEEMIQDKTWALHTALISPVSGHLENEAGMSLDAYIDNAESAAVSGEESGTDSRCSLELLPSSRTGCSETPIEYICRSSIKKGIPISISGNKVIDRLMHHYAEHVAVMLQPIQHHHNPYRQLYVPAALEAASTLTSEVHLQLQPSKTAVQSVIFHSLLASSAFHLWNCLPSQTLYAQLGVRHRQQALVLLRSAISLEMPMAEYKTLMVAMLSLVTIDFMSGCEADFAVHLQGTEQLRKRRRRWKIISRETQQLNEISDFLCLLARTMAFTEPPKAWLSNAADDTEGPLVFQPQSECCYGYMYGITPIVASAIQETCWLGEHLSWYESSEQPISDRLLDASEALGDRLCSWSLELDGFQNTITGNEDTIQIFRHHANAWHLAAVIYYHRRIQKCRAEDHDDLVDRVARHMHAVEDIKDLSASSATQRMAPIMWPAFVASCDARVRSPWQLWWQRVKCYHFGNYERQWEVIQQIWRANDAMIQREADDFDWIDAFKDLGIALFPI